MSGLLINGTLYQVPGVTVIGPHETAWSYLDAGDGCYRANHWPQQIILHKTIADDPEKIMPGVGPAGGAERTASYWEGDPHHAGAGTVTALDGTVACLCDLVTWMSYHATVSNLYSIGMETCELVGGTTYQAALDATVACVGVICRQTGIQLQIPKRGSYNGHPLKRMLNGGHDCYGVFGHRDNTEDRGHWDPGDMLFDMLVERYGAEEFDFAAGEDLAAWKRRQANLSSLGFYRGAIDGEPGRGTVAALVAYGFPGGVFVLGSDEHRAVVDAIDG